MSAEDSRGRESRVEIPETQRIAYLLGPERIEIRTEPVAGPGPGEVLVAIEAATTCGTDVKVFRRGGHPRMLRVPTPFGHELAGVVASVGDGVRSFVAGDRVVVSNSAPCGVCGPCVRGRENLCEDLRYLNGAFAQLIVVPARFVERALHRIPPTLDPGLATLTEPLACVLHGVEMSDARAPLDTAVLGAGPIGLLFVAVLAGRGHRVVAVDPNPGRLAVAEALGARATLRVERGGGQRDSILGAGPRGLGFDLIFEATGVPEVWEDALASVSPGGEVVLFGGCAPGTSVPLDTHHLHYSEITVRGVYHHRPATVAAAIELLAASAFRAELLISREEPLEALERALRAMMKKEALKVRIRP